MHEGGTYVCIEGPQFSTRAESNVYRQLGFDVIGMTNLQEAKLAREAELCYATMAMVTDYDVWYEGEEDVTLEQVLGQRAAQRGDGAGHRPRGSSSALDRQPRLFVPACRGARHQHAGRAHPAGDQRQARPAHRQVPALTRAVGGGVIEDATERTPRGVRASGVARDGAPEGRARAGCW